MNALRDLFEKYKRGILDEPGIEQLNRLLLECYFHSSGKMNDDELEYTEDLIFQMHGEKTLEEPYNQQFKDMLKSDPALGKKYFFHRDLMEAYRSGKRKQLKHALSATADDEQEEARLKEVLQEVFQKVHAEKETTPTIDNADSFVTAVKIFLQEMMALVQFNQPRVRWALVAASIVILAGFAWIFLKPVNPDMVAGDSIRNPEKTDQPFVSENSAIEKKDEKLLKENFRKKINDLVASAFKHAAQFDYVMTRGETTDALDSFIKAADKYNQKEFDSCRIILEGLRKSNSFSNPDTLSEINFFLGNCYLIRGINTNSDKHLQLSLLSFQRIDHQNQYYLPSKWYSVFAYAKMGQADESLRLCDTLIKVHYMQHGDVKRTRDSIIKIINFKPD